MSNESHVGQVVNLRPIVNRPLVGQDFILRRTSSPPLEATTQSPANPNGSSCAASPNGPDQPAPPILAEPLGCESAAPRPCILRDLGLQNYAAALDIQKEVAERRKRAEAPDHLLIVEHPHVITLGRNGHMQNLLASPEILERAGISFFHTDRGGDITYHGPGQIVGYPIFDLREWKRDVVAYVRTMEQAIIDALADFGIIAGRVAGCTGVWVDGKKIAAIGVHLSRWVTSHGFALNHATDLTYFQYIVPCGLTRPVTSMRELGCTASRRDVTAALVDHFAQLFNLRIEVPAS